MKKINTFLIMILVSAFTFAQNSGGGSDTTDFRFLGVGDAAEMIFQKTGFQAYHELSSNVTNDGGSGHAIFVNPLDGMLYAVLDSNNSGARGVYSVEPFTGQMTEVFRLGKYYASAEVADNGLVYGITGNGETTVGGNQGEIFEIDVLNQTQTSVFQTSVQADEPRAIGYHDNKLYVYSAENGQTTDSLYLVDMSSWSESVQSFNDAGDGEVHGLFMMGGNFIATSYYGEFIEIPIDTPTTSNLLNTVVEEVMDGTMFHVVDEDGQAPICDGSLPTLSSNYESNSYQWYKDGLMVPGETNDSYTPTLPGTYRLLLQIGTTASYFWSEEIVVSTATVPVVNLSSGQTFVCPNDSVMLTGSAGGSSQWYLDGQPIVGANSNTYFATEAGSYNMVKTNMSGCSDSASAPLVIVDGTTQQCASSVAEYGLADFVELYPVPASGQITVEYNELDVENITIVDNLGREVLALGNNESKRSVVDISSLESGIYFIRLRLDDQRVATKKFTKE